MLELKIKDNNSLKRKLKTARQKVNRYILKISSLTKVVDRLKKESLISFNCEEMLTKTFSGVPLHMMRRMTSGKKSGRGCGYNPDLMAFALTLHFYSAKAYEFVRKTFHLALPHQVTI